MVKLNALIVIYNKSLADSPAAESLRPLENVSVWVADNSTGDYGNRDFALARGYQYIDMGGNAGLSKAYNRVIALMEKDDGLLCLFDDDTTVDVRYFEILAAAAAANPSIDIFAPVVRDAKGILSPCIIQGAACKRLTSLEELPQSGLSAVNSGLAIRLRVFNQYRYDEGQFLDYIDHAFIRDIASNQRDKIFIMKQALLQQRFSGSEKQEREAAVRRYRVFRSDFIYFCKKYRVPWVSRSIVLVKRRIRLMLS